MNEKGFRHWPNDQTLLVQQFEFALQQMFDRFAMSKNFTFQHFWNNKVIANVQAQMMYC